MELQIRKKKNGESYAIQFTLFKQRKCLFLPMRYDLKTARRMVDVVEELKDAIETQRNVSKNVFQYVESLPEDVKARLARIGLLEVIEDVTLESIMDAFLLHTEKTQTSNTYRIRRDSYKRIERVLDVRQDYLSITRQDYENAFTGLLRTFSSATTNLALRNLKAAFSFAVKSEMIQTNPLVGMKVGSDLNKDREYFVDRETCAKVLEHGNDVQRALFALYRYGGLRRGEALLVQGRDIDWTNKRLLVHSPKTAIHGKATRTIPLFTELQTHLSPFLTYVNNLFDIPVHGETWLIKKMVVEAGIKPWTRLIQNLRSSRAIEIRRDYGTVAESEWLGHSSVTADKHYLHVTEEEFKRATEYSLNIR